jgi:hypothetical protein
MKTRHRRGRLFSKGGRWYSPTYGHRLIKYHIKYARTQGRHHWSLEEKEEEAEEGVPVPAPAATSTDPVMEPVHRVPHRTSPVSILMHTKLRTQQDPCLLPAQGLVYTDPPGTGTGTPDPTSTCLVRESVPTTWSPNLWSLRALIGFDALKYSLYIPIYYPLDYIQEPNPSYVRLHKMMIWHEHVLFPP